MKWNGCEAGEAVCVPSAKAREHIPTEVAREVVGFKEVVILSSN